MKKQRRKLALEARLTRGVKDTRKSENGQCHHWGHLQDDKTQLTWTKLPLALTFVPALGCASVFVNTGLRTWDQVFTFMGH